MKQILLIIIAFWVTTVAFAQNTDDIRLAFSYYNNREYDKASYLFDKIYNQTKSRSYFNYYLECLINIQDFEKAEKSAKKAVNAHKTDLCYKILLGRVYKRQSQYEKSNQVFDEVIAEMPADKNKIVQISYQFLQISEPNYAEKVLEKGKSLVNDNFSQELFTVYASARNFQKMAEVGLDLLEEDQSKLSHVQSMFQYNITSDVNDEFYDILRLALLQRIQKNPTTSFSQLLIWLFVQKQNFKSALIQAKALDKRLNESGQRVISLGDDALQAKDYESAVACYKYVLEKGNSSPYYNRAQFGIITSMYEQVLDGTISTPEEIAYLESQYDKTFQEFGINGKTINEVKNYARLETYYLNKPEKAKELIEKALTLPGLNYLQKAQLNLELGDIELFMDDVWGATMTYAKVENDNKQNEYGDEAKFRKAKIAFYTGNFKWAQSQLDVLKAATSKLVANDAMELCLIISDNAERSNPMSGDTAVTSDENLNTSVDLRIYARAHLYSTQNQYEKSVASLDSIITEFPTSGLVDEAYFLKAQICEKQRDWEKASEYYKKVADDYSFDVLADKASYYFAEICNLRLDNKELAKEYYMKILTDYPGSVFAVDSREKYRSLSAQ